MRSATQDSNIFNFVNKVPICSVKKGKHTFIQSSVAQNFQYHGSLLQILTRSLDLLHRITVTRKTLSAIRGTFIFGIFTSRERT
jgi:hypothetical protein